MYQILKSFWYLIAQTHPHKLVAAWIRILLTFLISYASSVLADIRTESSCFFQKCERNSGRCRILFYFLPWSFEQTLVHQSIPTVGGWWSQWGKKWQLVIAIYEGDCLLLCLWYSQGYDCTCSFCFCLSGTDTLANLLSVLLEFSLQSHGYIC
jgi:hypothetical protein